MDFYKPMNIDGETLWNAIREKYPDKELSMFSDGKFKIDITDVEWQTILSMLQK